MVPARYKLVFHPQNYLSLMTYIGKRLLGFFNEEDHHQALLGNFRKILGKSELTFVSQARSGIYYCLKTFIRPGDEVIVSAYNLVDVINMVQCAGAKPIFCDIDLHGFGPTIEELEKVTTAKTKAVIYTHLYGYCGNIVAVEKWCAQKGIKLIEDCAQAFGAKIQGKLAGTWGDYGVYSFGLYKNLNSFIGGLIVSKNEKLYLNLLSNMGSPEKLKMRIFAKKLIKAMILDLATHRFVFKLVTHPLFKHGFLKNWSPVIKLGSVDHSPTSYSQIPAWYLSKMRPIQTYILSKQLESFAEREKKRIELALMYFEGLGNLQELTLPPKEITGKHVYTYFPVLVPNRREFLESLYKMNLDMPLHKFNDCSSLDCFSERTHFCKNAQFVSNRVVLLPLYSTLSIQEIQRIIHCIRVYFGYA